MSVAVLGKSGHLPQAVEDANGQKFEYPGLPTDYVMEMVHRFYDEYYFRPKAAWRVVSKAIVNRDLGRLYQESKSFLKLRAQRNRLVKETKRQNAGKTGEAAQVGA